MEEKTPVTFNLQRQNTSRDVASGRNKIEKGYYWDTCICGKTDQRVAIFAVQVFFGITMMCFCFYKLSTSPTCAEENVYISLLSGTVGIFLPSPKLIK